MTKEQRIADLFFTENNYHKSFCCCNCNHFYYVGQFSEGYWNCNLLPDRASEVDPYRVCDNFAMEK